MESGNKLTVVGGKEVAVQAESDESKLDEHGRVIHEDMINFRLDHKDLIFIHETIQLVMNKGLAPEEEVGPIITLMEMIGEREKVVWETKHLYLPVNYFVGMWHCLNTARKFALYKQQWKVKDKMLDKITKRVAESIDAYHTIKSHEKNEDKMNTKPYFKEVSKEAPKIVFEDKVEDTHSKGEKEGKG